MNKRFLKITSYSHTNGPDSRNVMCVEVANIYLYHSEYRKDIRVLTGMDVLEPQQHECTRVHYYEMKGETNYKLLYCHVDAFENLIKGAIDRLFARTENSMLEYTVVSLPA